MSSSEFYKPKTMRPTEFFTSSLGAEFQEKKENK